MSCCQLAAQTFISMIILGVAASGLASQLQPASSPETQRLGEVRKLLRQVPLIDGHNDLPWQYRKRSNDFSMINLREDTRKLKSPLVTDIARLRQGGLGGQFWSVYIPPTLSGPEAVKAVFEQI